MARVEEKVGRLVALWASLLLILWPELDIPVLNTSFVCFVPTILLFLAS